MKNLLSICFVLIINFSFAQENSSDILRTFNNHQKNAFMANNNENAHFVNNPRIVSLDFNNLIKVNEGKFSLKEIHDKSLTSLLIDLDQNTTAQFLAVEEIISSKISVTAKKSMILATNQKFIDNLITAKILQEGLLNGSKKYSDKNDNLYGNYPKMLNLLIVNYILSENLELQIGNSIYPYLNKPFKTELDKTLSSSLNLLAINF
ncbi:MULTISPECIES: hypothetical protein [unclassified Polaribacter]|uniref:hypothetical protein n=1 Tax=unclassified Polaribacter TaxID=196858 RepID=UPI0011BF1046|nr:MULTISPECIES: hypothetical protein [unclassified Polaribacter]TXD54435.1 hypothetical protein ES043_00885 [Polaribacter sp. IC063]TXD60348.1 hypothetical protein ES044_07715 [Polaribacter sp. IC066]